MRAVRGIFNLSSSLPRESTLPLDDGFQELSENLITPVSLSITRWKGESKPFLPTSKENYTSWKDVRLKFKSFEDFTGEGISMYKQSDLKMKIKDGSITLNSDQKEVQQLPSFKNNMSSGKYYSHSTKSLSSFTKSQSNISKVEWSMLNPGFSEPVRDGYNVNFTKYYSEDYKGVESLHRGELILNKQLRTMYIKGVFEVSRNSKVLYGGPFEIEADVLTISEIFSALQWEGLVVLKKKKIPVKVGRSKKSTLGKFSKYTSPEMKEDDPKVTLVNVTLEARDFELDFSGVVSDNPLQAKEIRLSCNSSRNKHIGKFVEKVHTGDVNVSWIRRHWDFSEVAIQLWVSDKYSKYRIELNGKYVET